MPVAAADPATEEEAEGAAGEEAEEGAEAEAEAGDVDAVEAGYRPSYASLGFPLIFLPKNKNYFWQKKFPTFFASNPPTHLPQSHLRAIYFT